MADFIERLTIQNYACLKDVDIELSPLHAFIGPNDSGKSTILRAVRTALQFAGGLFGPNGSPFSPGIDFRPQGEPVSIKITFQDKLNYTLSASEQGIVESIGEDSGHVIFSAPRQAWNVNTLEKYRGDEVAKFSTLLRRLTPARMLRLEPDFLRMPSVLIQEGHSGSFFDERGTGLPAVYDYIINRDVEAFLSISHEVRRLFPSVHKLGLTNVTTGMKAMEMTLTTGQRVSAEFMSEGMLYYLAFAALPHLAPTSVILVEEPENGLHPARIAEVMGVLREVSKTTQVLIATHSPLVVNELLPHEVSVVTRRPDTGTKVTRIDKTPDFEDRFKIYALGELWISYANGMDEAPLLEGREP